MIPGYWMNEISGVLRPAIGAYLSGAEMSIEQIVTIRAYLRQWIAGDWHGPHIAQLRREVELLTSRDEIAAWLRAAGDLGIDPL